ncbi:hypothetical protein [Microvirga brassicacearum]|uniref:EamA domain-containing protein n=1 Tax=Microvirga brassicacearum TaxID=2580413 RepID=A0A5N3PIY7_9HYPH|nr:hypothetical protein [Microvirga brassicacearum]KAB0269709.1 hypothetical protein FEZ63_00100 [Microvirga brassicacearum]
MSTLLLLVLMIGCTVIANLMMKLGAGDPASAVLLGLISWRTFIGLVIFATAAAFYAFVLKVLPLNLAQAYAAAQFVAVICAAALLLGEPITFMRWVGISLISGGIMIVALSSETSL